ncbi:MAG TPA: EAL domain-containing protein [Armatimonadota bacterium]|nr:EAL domain-containing protein [Armatimonadota bacterium]
MLSNISYNAVITNDPAQFQQECLEIIGSTIGAAHAYIFEHCHDTNTVCNTFEWAAIGMASHKEMFQEASSGSLSWWIDQLTQDKIICYSDIEQIPDERQKKLLQERSVKSILIVPLFVDRTYYGFIGFDNCKTHREWPDEDIEILRTTSRIIAWVIQRKKTEANLRIQTSAINAASDQILIIDDQGKIEFVNPAFETETGFTFEEVVGQPMMTIRSNTHDEGFYEDLWKTIRTGRHWYGEMTGVRKDGSIYTEDVSITPVKNEAGIIERYIAIKRNITEKKIYEQKLDHLAHHDVLTGLPNRLLFSDRLSKSLAQARRDDRLLAVMFLDLDRFKMINDTLGHNIGDKLLKQVAERLTGTLREVDTIARMGGDEFTLVIEGISRAQDAAIVAQRALDVFCQPFMVDGRELFVTASIGISMYPNDGADVETLVRNADTSMYRAKEQGRNTYHLFTESLNATVFERMVMEHSLRKALERDEFIVHYQPRVDIRSGSILGAEALVRWQHPEMGLVMPGQFIPLAEETGLIVPISEWVLDAACSQSKIWQDKNSPILDIAVNISARQFQKGDLVSAVKKALDRTELDPTCLHLELTESILMHNTDAAIDILNKLKDMGVKISIDDFGTGYSSLSYLKKFPVDAVKIDRSFIKDITTNPDDAAIAGAVIAMAHSLKLKVIAEGVETLEQLEFLKSINCDEMQGYFISRPVPAEEFHHLLWMQRYSPNMESLFVA